MKLRGNWPFGQSTKGPLNVKIDLTVNLIVARDWMEKLEPFVEDEDLSEFKYDLKLINQAIKYGLSQI